MSSPIDIYSLTISRVTLVYLILAEFEFYKYYLSNYTVTCSFPLGRVAHGLRNNKGSLVITHSEYFLIDCPVVVGLWVSFKWHRGKNSGC